MPSTTDYQLHGDAAPSQSRKSETALILGATGPLLLAIAGSAIVPLPCAFGQMGIPAGTAFMVLVALANDHTTVLLVRAAARLRVSSYEEVVLCTIGPHGLFWARVSLVVLLFGTQCGSLAAIQETAVRAAQLAGLPWLAGTSGGHALLLLVPAATVVMPLSLLSLGEMSGLSVFGVTIMTGVALYLLYYAAAAGDLSRPLEPYEAEVRWAAVPQAVSTLGYAFYIQPCALPMLNQLPGGAEGARLLERALHLTFVLTTLVYLAIGASGLLFFGANTPQDVLQGFGGGAGAALSALFALYLMLCFPPMLVPLRETLVRLFRHLERRAVYLRTPPELRPALGAADERALEFGSSSTVALPPALNAMVTCAIIGAALCVALALPDASASLFSLTGATGVCLVAYVFPIAAHWALPAAAAGDWRAVHPAASAGVRARLLTVLEWGWLGAVLVLGLGVSGVSLLSIVRGWSAHDATVCVEPQGAA